MTDTPDTTLAGWDRYLMHTYPVPPVEIVDGHGATVTTADGKELVDFLGGIAVNSLGYGDPRLVAAVTEQAGHFTHVSNLLGSRPVVDVARGLVERFVAAGAPAEPGATRAFFCNSGTEANEAAFKIARKTGKTRILAAHHGFHGRTMGALSITGQPAKRDIFAPLPGGAEFYPYGDLDYLRKLIEMDPGDTAAVILEPVQGETGVVPAPEGFLNGVRELCDEFDLLMIVDEVQTGVGRTGTFFAFEDSGVVPDVVTMAKGLGAGLPIGAVLAAGEAAELFRPGDHGTTFGGNPVACAAARVVLETVDDDFLAQVRARGERLAAALEQVEGVASVRGRGLMRAAVLERDVAKRAVELGRDHGVVLNACGAGVLRFVPPLVVTDAEIDAGVRATAAAIAAAVAEADNAESPGETDRKN